MASPSQPVPSVHERLVASRALITSLPYIEAEYDTPELRSEANRLVRAEMATFTPPDYLGGFAPVDLGLSKIAQQEMERVERGDELSAVSMGRYRLPQPSAEQEDDESAWRSALDNAHAQLEHQHARILNLELAKKFGTNAWRAHVDALSSMQRTAERELGAKRRQCEELNVRRKTVQRQQGELITRLTRKRRELVGKNFALSQATAEVEREVKRLRTVASAKGIVFEQE